MTADVRATAREIAGRAAELPYGPVQVALHEEAIALADRHGDDELGFELRGKAVIAFYNGRRADLMLVHFARCVAYHDSYPNAAPVRVLFIYRWVFGLLPRFDSIPLATIRQTWQDMNVRYQSAGWSLRSPWQSRRLVECETGHAGEAVDSDCRYRQYPRDAYTYAPGDEAALDIHYLSTQQNDRETIRMATPFLDGTFSEARSTSDVFDILLMPLARQGRLVEAQALLKRSSRVRNARPELLGTADLQFEFLAVTQDFASALRTVDRHFGPSLARPGRLDSFDTLRFTKLLTTRLLKVGRHRLTLRVGEGVVPGYGPRAPVAALDEWLSMELAAVGKLGDDRNGNDSYARRVAELDELNDLADRLQRTTAGTR